MITQLLTPTHLAILVVVVLLVFGAKRVPQTARALGQSLFEFKEAVTGRDTPAPGDRASLTPGPEMHSRRLPE